MIYENIQRLCEANHISIFKLEQTCGIGNGTIGRWVEKGAVPRINTVKAVADYFGVPVDDLLKENGVESPTL